MLKSLQKKLFIYTIIGLLTTFLATIFAQNQIAPRRLGQKPFYPKWQSVRIKPGDTLQHVFAHQHIPQQNLWQLLKLKNHAFTKLTPGHKIDYLLDRQRHLLSLRMPLSTGKVIQLTQAKHSYAEKIIQIPQKTVHGKTTLTYKSGIVSGSLQHSIKRAGLTNKMYYQFVKIFSKKINFSHDIRPGDQFSVLYDQYSVHGKNASEDDIVVAKLTTHKKTYCMIRFSYPNHQAQYYTPSGYTSEPRFLEYPLHYKRISSPFSYHRLDPVKHNMRPHLGIDFAAEPGTPIYSIGNGHIEFVGHEHGFGNAVKIRYDQQYSALYAHMQRFAKNLRPHEFVQKGQVIGYVGSTGWATGPHLHFGFFVNNKPQNWLALAHPAGTIPEPYRQQFKQLANRFLAELELYQDTKLAENTTDIHSTTH